MRRPLSLLLLFALQLVAPALAPADSPSGASVVVQSDRDRRNVVVMVPVALESTIRFDDRLTLTTASGMRITAQLTHPGVELDAGGGKWSPPPGMIAANTPVLSGPPGREASRTPNPRRIALLTFVLPVVKAGAKESLALDWPRDAHLPSPIAKRAEFAWHDTPGKFMDLKLGDRPVLRYMYEPLDDSSPQRRNETYKVFHHVYSPDGKQLLTKGDPAGLFPHHRGLFYGFNIVTYDGQQRADVWHCTGDAHQLHKSFESAESGPVLGRHSLEIAWNGKGKKTFAIEHREMAAYAIPGGTLIDFVSRLVPTDGPVKLDGDPQHAGFHFRAAQEVADSTKGQTYYLRTDGPGKPGQTLNWDPKKPESDEARRSINRPWNAMSFVVGGKRYTALYMDHPANPKPARYSERDYGRFGSYFVTEATREKPLSVRYRVWIKEGEMTRDEAAAMAADFVDPVRATVVSNGK